jgi:predicted Zn-ribbon and HTH transcriptional regulator
LIFAVELWKERKVKVAKKCPKCDGNMIEQNAVHTLPALRDPYSSEQGDTISVRKAIVVQPVVCGQCGLVEMYFVRNFGPELL